MKNFSSDKIAVIGLVAALLLSVISCIFSGTGGEVTNNIASLLGEYIGGRVIRHEGGDLNDLQRPK